MSIRNSHREKIDISIVIPAKNEAKRLPRFLMAVFDYCNKSSKKYEIIVVDDGSTDETYEEALELKKLYLSLQVPSLKRNRGKGFAVKYGILRARGDIVLFIDADGSTLPDEIESNIRYFQEGYDIIIGSRNIKGKKQLIKARIHRRLMGKIFNFCVHRFLLKEIGDTQCGFKMFRQEIIKPLFSQVKIYGFGFDMEVLYLANKLGYKIKEVPIRWRHVRGSKVNVLTDSLRMFFNIFQIRIWHGK
ncbi:MAG: glycosyltransferase family 2 protein [Candidatus Omnitrophica bacterium]|nr:glycosyltransferase family 2 protein [Candidatus Omnitrophota bacterium]